VTTSTTPNLDGVIKALGEELTILCGYLATRLTADLTAVGAVANVESTIDFPVPVAPAVGVIYIEGERITYTGVAVGQLTGLTRDPTRAKAHLAGATVADGSSSYSQMDRVRSDLLLSLATGAALDRVAWRSGERRPLGATDAAFLAMLQAILYAPRGIWRTLYRALSALLAPYRVSGTATTNPATPTLLTDVTAPFTAQHIGRLVEIGGLAYRVNGVSGAGTVLELNAYRGPWFCAGSIGTGANVGYTIQPFRIVERPADNPGIVELAVWLPTVLLPDPSYLLDETVPGVPDFTPGGTWVEGSGVVDDETIAGTGRKPWYLPGLSDEAFLDLLEELVPLGIDVETTAVGVI